MALTLWKRGHLGVLWKRGAGRNQRRRRGGGTSGGEGELDGTSGDEGELDGTSGDDGELDGTSGDDGELDGTSGDEGGHLRGAGTGGHLRGAGTVGHLRGAGTGGHLRGAGTGLGRATTGGLAILSSGGLAILSGGGGFGKRGADFSADRTDVKHGSSTFAPRSALLETHLRARGNTRECGRPQSLVRHEGVTSDGTPTRDQRLSRHRMTVSF